MGRRDGIVGVQLRTASVSGGFNNIRTLGRIGISVINNRIRYLTNRGNSNGSAVIGVLSNILAPGKKIVAISNAPCRDLATQRTVNLNVTIVRRSLSLFNAVDIQSGVYLPRRIRRRESLVGPRCTRSMSHGTVTQVNTSLSLSTHIRGLSVTSGRRITVTETLTLGTGIVFVSRPAATLASARISDLLHAVNTLGTSKISIVFVSRGLSRIFSITSHVAIFHSNRMVNACRTSRLSDHGLSTLVAKRSIRFNIPRGRVMTSTAPILRVGRIGTSGISSIALEMRTNRIINVDNLLKSKHARATLALFNLGTLANNDVTVSNRPTTVHGPHSTVTGNVTLIPRSERHRKLFLSHGLLRGDTTDILREVSDEFNIIGIGGRHRVNRSALIGLRIGAHSLTLLTRSLSNNGRRGILLKG